MLQEKHMATLWLVRRGDETTSPLTTAQLKQCARNGQVKPDDLIAKAGTEKWQCAEKVQGLELPAVSSGGEIIHAKATPAVRELADPPPAPVPTVATVTAPSPSPESQLSTEAETPVWSGRPSQAVNAKTFLLCGLFFWLVVPIFVAIKKFLAIHGVYYELTTQRLRVTRGFINVRVNELELYRVKDTAFDQTLSQRLFGLGSIQLYTSDRSSPTVWIYAIPAATAKELREQIRTFTEELRTRKGIREVDRV